jgi:hypothetical protein
MVEISKSGSGEGLGRVTAPGYSTGLVGGRQVRFALLRRSGRAPRLVLARTRRETFRGAREGDSESLAPGWGPSASLRRSRKLTGEPTRP